MECLKEMVNSELPEHHVELQDIMEEPEDEEQEHNTTFHDNMACKENCVDESVVTNSSANYR